MSCLLIGADFDSAFLVLHDKLRANTLDYAQRKYNRVIGKYNPWLCFSPVLDELNDELTYFQPVVRGGLIDNVDALKNMSAFLEGEGREAIEDLPGHYTAWLPRNTKTSDAFYDSVSIIKSLDETVRSLYDEIVEFIVPLGGGRSRGYSTHLARGAIFRSLPVESNSYDIAIDIVHEIGHQVLMVWQSIDPILSTDQTAPIYSQIRRTNRPAIQSFHAAVALAYMRYLERAASDNTDMMAATSRRGIAYSKTLSYSLELAIASIRTSCGLTDIGATMLDEMEALV